MLAVRSYMERPPPRKSSQSNAPDLLRQPSAEDLDAAYQLISSARGEWVDGQDDMDDSQTSTSIQKTPPAVGTVANDKIEAANGSLSEDSPVTGQICR